MTGSLLNTKLLLDVLQPPGSAFEAHVNQAHENSIVVACRQGLQVGMAVRLQDSCQVMLGEVVKVENTQLGSQAELEIQHVLLRADIERIRSKFGVPELPRGHADAVGA